MNPETVVGPRASSKPEIGACGRRRDVGGDDSNGAAGQRLRLPRLPGAGGAGAGGIPLQRGQGAGRRPALHRLLAGEESTQDRFTEHRGVRMMPNQFEILQDLFWSGEIGDAEFYQLAFEAGVSVEKIAAFLAEVREQDGIPA